MLRLVKEAPSEDGVLIQLIGFGVYLSSAAFMIYFGGKGLVSENDFRQLGGMLGISMAVAVLRSSREPAQNLWRILRENARKKRLSAKPRNFTLIR